MIARLMARVGLVTPEQRAWAWYDWANSVYFTTVITAVFPSFFATYAAAGLEPAQATARFGLVTTASVAVVAIMSPILGALADYSGIKKKLLALFMSIGVLACAAMVFITEGNIALASLLFFIGNIGVSGSLVFYDSLLPHVAAPEQTDRVSAAGYAMGYVSGGVMLLINLAWILQPQAFGFDTTVSAIRASFVAVALWWAVFSLPLFRKVPEPSGTRAPISILAAFRRLARTLQEIRKYRHAFLMFIAMLLYQDGIQTIIRMAGVYGAEVGIEQTSQIAAFVMVQFVGIPFSFLFGALGTKLGTKRCIFIAISVYALATILAFFMTRAIHFFALAFLIGTVQGGAQALSRALFARLIPRDRTSEFFGFF
ncbi:MAG TPA: MFS transporter, partial [Vicinamibacterales bacterium]|nr:MFS transporter [Vicinamibacterales bacterium]